ncbi:MAG: YceI family protein [Chitinophagaceae bacterium]
MRYQSSICLTLVLLLLATFQTSAQTYTAKSYKILVDGTSTMHEWSTAATTVNAQCDFTIANGGIQKINSAVITIPVKSLKSTKNSGLMDSRTYETLKADNNPNITFVVTNILSNQQNGGEGTISIRGNLTIAGKTNPTELVLKTKVLPNGDIEVKGSKKILMSSHGVKAPSFMLGALKVGDEVTITFDVILAKK